MDSTTLAVETFWARVLQALPSDGHEHVKSILPEAEDRRIRADYDTGSITEDEAVRLLALAQWITARVILEVGTFIGVSTVALSRAHGVEAVYTCDASNDCLPSAGVIHTYPKRNSTTMLRDLIKRQVRADLCFFDGVLMPPDPELLLRVTHRQTVYAFHDYNFGPKIRKGGVLETVPRKGIGNVRALQPLLPRYALIEPPPDTTLALLVPETKL